MSAFDKPDSFTTNSYLHFDCMFKVMPILLNFRNCFLFFTKTLFSVLLHRNIFIYSQFLAISCYLSFHDFNQQQTIDYFGMPHLSHTKFLLLLILVEFKFDLKALFNCQFANSFPYYIISKKQLR